MRTTLMNLFETFENSTFNSRGEIYQMSPTAQKSPSNARGWFIKFCLMCIKPRLDESNSHHFAFDNSMTQFLRRIYI